MNSVRLSALNILLAALTFSPCACSKAKTPAQTPATSPGVHVDRQSRDDGMILSRYLDLRSARILLVKGGTDPALVKQWMASFKEMKDDSSDPLVPQMSKMLTANLPKGLLGMTTYLNNVRVTVYSGELPGEKEAIKVDARDIRSGTSVTSDGAASMDDYTAWLDAAKKATSESEFVPLLTANLAKGMSAVSGVFDGISVETFWQRK